MDERGHQRNPAMTGGDGDQHINAPAPAHQVPVARTPSPRSEGPNHSRAREPIGQGRFDYYPLPPLPYEGNPDVQRPVIADPVEVDRTRGDWIDNKNAMHNVGERLQPTLDMAHVERAKYAMKAKMTGYALNIAIGLQVLLGSLTTGLSVVTTGRQTSIMTTILGGLATIVASYLARARGSNEPELSITRVKDLEQFIRECQAFQLDYGLAYGHEFDDQVNKFRRGFEELLGNANGERKLSPPV